MINLISINKLGISFIAAVSFFTIVFSSFNKCWAEEYPKAIRLQQSFKKGEKFYYQLTEIRDQISVEGKQKGNPSTFVYLLDVTSVSSDGIVNTTISQVDGSRIGKAIGGNNCVFPSYSTGKRVSISLLPDGRREITEGESHSVKWRELILQDLPREEITVGKSWEFIYNLPAGSKEKGEAKQVIDILGFEEVNGYDCVKVRIVSIRNRELNDLSRHSQHEKEVFLAFRKGFLVVKSHAKYTMKLGKVTSVSTTVVSTTIRETNVELLNGAVNKQWEKAFNFMQQGKRLQHEKKSLEALLAYQKAIEILKLISREKPDWNTKAIKAKIDECNRAFNELKKEPRPTPTALAVDKKLK